MTQPEGGGCAWLLTSSSPPSPAAMSVLLLGSSGTNLGCDNISPCWTVILWSCLPSSRLKLEGVGHVRLQGGGARDLVMNVMYHSPRVPGFVGGNSIIVQNRTD